jgi:DNA repair exonuclease SbcCD ATPase subunit
MKIHLSKLKLTNFKGIRAFEVAFNKTVTDIYGRNEAGKTTLFDAFLWMLFGKDSSDRKDFAIKTLDDQNQPFHRLDHEVEGTLDVDGDIIVLRRHFKEKWVAKRGTTTPEFSGHETVYYWNDVPMMQKEFEQKISGLLNESVFKLITNTTYFNSLKWQDRRATLISIAGKINDADVAKGNAAFLELLKTIAGKKTIEEYKREIVANKKKIKEQLELLPSRIAEAKLALPEEKDYDIIDEQINEVNVQIDGIDGLLQNKSRAYQLHQEKINTLVNRKQDLSSLMMDIEFTAKTKVQNNKQVRLAKINEERNTLSAKINEKSTLLNDYNIAANKKTALLNEQIDLRKQWEAINNEKLDFKDGEFSCPACKREFEADKIESKKTELTNNFNADKSKRLTAITDRGTAITNVLADLDKTITNITASGTILKSEIEIIESRIAELQKEHDRLSADEAGEMEKEIAGSTTYQKCVTDIAELEQQMNIPYEAEDNSALAFRKKQLQEQINSFRTELATKGQRDQQMKRIDELEGQEATMAQELAELEGKEFTIEQFTKAKMDELESRINGRFKIVKFKMFEDQINGGQVEACTTLVNGVPFSDVNTAGRIQAGLDIINTLSEHYGVQAPVWVDNRESVTLLPDTECQLINLIVSPKDKKLRVGSAVAEEAMA